MKVNDMDGNFGSGTLGLLEFPRMKKPPAGAFKNDACGRTCDLSTKPFH